MRNWIIVFFVIFAARLSAHDGDSIKITHGPYLCDMSTDGVTVVWTTNKPALRGWKWRLPVKIISMGRNVRDITIRSPDVSGPMIQSTVYASNIWNSAGNTDTGFFREKLSLGLRVTG